MDGFLFGTIIKVEESNIVCVVNLTEELEIRTTLDYKTIVGRGIPEPGDKIMFNGKLAHLYKDTRTYYTKLADSLIKELEKGKK